MGTLSKSQNFNVQDSPFTQTSKWTSSDLRELGLFLVTECWVTAITSILSTEQKCFHMKLLLKHNTEAAQIIRVQLNTLTCVITTQSRNPHSNQAPSIPSTSAILISITIVVIALSVPKLYINGKIQYVCFYVWLLLLNSMLVKFILIIICSNSVFIFHCCIKTLPLYKNSKIYVSLLFMGFWVFTYRE